MPFEWGSLAGYDLFGPTVDIPAGATAVDAAAYEAVRVEAGFPRHGHELDERTIPAEAGLVEASVSFTKGCYTGQELVARVDARGANTPRRLHGVVITDAVRPAGGDEILVDGVAVGALTSVAWSPGFAAHVALAAVKRGTETTHEAQVIGAGGSARASIRSLPMVSG